MKKARPLLFSVTLNEKVEENLQSGFSAHIWKPKYTSLVPPGLSIKYIFFSLLSFLKFGRFSDLYSKVILRKEGKVVGSLLVIPKYWSYPFMNQNDVQLIYVVIYPQCRGRGYGKILLGQTLTYLSKKTNVKQVWYVTTEDNIASQNLAISSSFRLIGTGRRVFFKRIKIRSKGDRYPRTKSR